LKWSLLFYHRRGPTTGHSPSTGETHCTHCNSIHVLLPFISTWRPCELLRWRKHEPYLMQGSALSLGETINFGAIWSLPLPHYSGEDWWLAFRRWGLVASPPPRVFLAFSC
jgi:hypothetical protein